LQVFEKRALIERPSVWNELLWSARPFNRQISSKGKARCRSRSDIKTTHPPPSIHVPATRAERMLSTSSLAILRVTCLALTSAAALNGPAKSQKSSRRTFLAGVAATPLLVAGPLKSRAASTDGPREPQSSTDGRRDPRTTSSFFGLAAPPIQGIWSYDELVEQAKAENLATIQTAVQHDCIVATTHEGTRFASMVADKTVPLLLIGERVTHSTELRCRPRAAHPHAPNSGPAWRVQTARSPTGACLSRCFPSTRIGQPCATWQRSSST